MVLEPDPTRLTILGHVLFLRNHESVVSGLLEFREPIERGHTIISTLLADTFRALNIVWSTQ